MSRQGALTVNGSLAELHLGQDLAEVVETATPRWSNAPDRHAQLLGDRLVREIVIAHQQAEKTLATRREPFGCRFVSLLSAPPSRGRHREDRPRHRP